MTIQKALSKYAAGLGLCMASVGCNIPDGGSSQSPGGAERSSGQGESHGSNGHQGNNGACDWDHNRHHYGWSNGDNGNHYRWGNQGDADCSPPSSPSSCVDVSYNQPSSGLSGSADLLFVMDTSASMNDNRVKVSRGLSSFIGQLPQSIDYRIAVMLATGSKSSWSGSLFSYNGNRVFDSKKTSLSQIQGQIEKMVLSFPLDAQNEQGEAGSYSLLKGLSSKLQENQAHGFFRPGAVLSVIFVSDENDICTPAAAFTKATVPFWTQVELEQRKRDCANGINTVDIQNAVKKVAGSNVMFGAIVHTNPKYKGQGQDSYGWGYMDTVLASNGIAADIEATDYTQGLSDLGRLAAKKLDLVLDYKLTGTVQVSSIQVKVDGVSVPFVFDAEQNEVRLTDGGGPLSRVNLHYCQGSDPVPSPSPTASPTPVPSPSPTASPTPVPSPSPTASPTPVPSPSPTASPIPVPSPSPTASPEPSVIPPVCVGLACGTQGQ